MQGQNPLDQLRANHLPDPVSFWPPAIGWWILALLVLILLVAAGYWLTRYWLRNRYRKQGCLQADTLYMKYQQHKNPRQFAHDCNRLLKQVALHAYPQQNIAALHGSKWLQFLATTGRNQQFTEKEGQALGEGRFTPRGTQDDPSDVTTLHRLTQSWIRKHHA